MTDITITDFHDSFKYKARVELRKEKVKLKNLTESLDNLYQRVIPHIDYYVTKCGINLYKYKEFDERKDSTHHSLLVKCRELYYNTDNSVKQEKLNILITYCICLRDIANCQENIDYYTKCQSIGILDYRRIIAKYYLMVQDKIMQGHGYKFAHNLGTLTMNYWKRTMNFRNKKLDYQKTKQRKQELLAQGYRLWNQAEADWYEKRNIPYDGVDYRVYLDSDAIYDLAFVDVKGKGNERHLKFVCSKYKPHAIQNTPLDVLAERFDTYDKVLNSGLNLYMKVNLCIRNGITSHLTYKRNNDYDRFYKR